MLEHLPARAEALANMVAATKPGGVVVVEDIDWHHFDDQPLPEPFSTLHFVLREAAVSGYGYDPYYGGKLHQALAQADLEDVDVRGRVYLMHGGTPNCEWCDSDSRSAERTSNPAGRNERPVSAITLLPAGITISGW